MTGKDRDNDDFSLESGSGSDSGSGSGSGSDAGSSLGSDDETTVIAELEDDAPRSEVLEFDELTRADNDAEPASKRTKGWGRVFRGNKGLWITAAIAVVALVAGLLIGHFITSPADEANNAKPPKPGLVTVPVEYGELSNDVTIRSDVGYADSVEVKLDTSSFTGGAVVTGQVPAVGAEIKPLSIVAEISGRPVFVLPGDLPTYRTLRMGVSGPDVLQLRQALTSIGINAGDVNNNVFDQSLADGIAALYAQIGYPQPPLEEGAAEAYKSAQQSVTDSEAAVETAQAALDKLWSGDVDPVELKTADNAVASAQRALSTAEGMTPRDENAIADARDNLSLAQLQRDQLFAEKDSTVEQTALDAAKANLTTAQESAETARQATLSYLPASEVLYLNQLPRIISEVTIERGKVVDGVAMKVSGATLELSGTVAPADGKLLEVGGPATFPLPDDSEHTATIAKVEPGATAADRWTVTLTPAAFTPEQMDLVQGTNVRVQIPVGATEGKVLSVPPSALTAGPGGESRVEVVVGDPKNGKEAETRLVTVETGLAADGYVEIKPTKGKLEEGDLVVVGS